MKTTSRIIRALMLVALLASTFTAYADVQGKLQISPDEGTVDMLPDTYTIKGIDGASVAAGTSTDAVQLIRYDNLTPVSTIDMEAAFLGKNFIIRFPSSVVKPTEAGIYVLTIPEGRILVDGEPNEVLEYYYTIESPEADTPGDTDDVAITVTPAPGVVTEVGYWEIHFSGNWCLGSKRSAKFIVEGPEGVTIPKLQSFSMGEYYVVCFEDDAILKAPGKYTLTLPAAKFAVGPESQEVDCEEMTFVYEIEDNGQGTEIFPDYAIDPAPGEYAAINDGFRLLIDTEDELTVDTESVTLEGPEGAIKIFVDATPQIPCVNIIPVDDNDDPVELTTPGAYTLTFPAGSVVAGTAKSDELRFRYVITDPATLWNGEYTADPADESDVEVIKNINITFVGAKKVTLAEFPSPADAPSLYDNATGIKVQTGTAFPNGNVLEVSMYTETKAPGNYTFVLGSAFFLVDDKKMNGDVYLSYTILDDGSGVDYTVTLDPADGAQIEFTGDIKLTFAGEGLKSISPDPYAWGTAAPRFTSADGNYCPGVQLVQDGLEFTLSHNWPFEVEGEYTLIIPADYFTLETSTGQTSGNKTITATYHVVESTTSIESVLGDSDEPVEVYTPNGIRVATVTKVSDIHKLPAGVYVAKGKKIIKK